MTVSERFNTFLQRIALTPDQQSDGKKKHSGVRRCLNSHYYGTSSDSANSLLVGSWGKSTEVRPPRDIDVLFVLPPLVYERFQKHQGNKQSALLQELKGVLTKTYPSTKMRADGQVVVVPFASYAVEIVPGFLLKNSQYWICDTNEGGKYKTTDPKAEIEAVSKSNQASNGNTRALIRMLKRWQETCSVPLRSFLLELVSIQFLLEWEYRGKSSIYYDWMVRDFFAFLLRQENWRVVVPGTSELIRLGNTWKSKAESAYSRAYKACEYESNEQPCNAGTEWQKIFGSDVPPC